MVKWNGKGDRYSGKDSPLLPPPLQPIRRIRAGRGGRSLSALDLRDWRKCESRSDLRRWAGHRRRGIRAGRALPLPAEPVNSDLDHLPRGWLLWGARLFGALR